jgi:DMSO/TMAO reductase YedYZ molybdopterin-dependent catalytic subunit
VVKRPVDMTRRKFVQLALASTAAALAEAACRGTAPAPAAAPSPTAQPPLGAPEPVAAPSLSAQPSPGTPSPTAVALPPLPHNTPRLLGNRNDDHYNVRYVKAFAPVDHAAWQLEVGGMVEAGGRFSLDDLLAWPQMEQVSRMACVEGWSFRAKWGGFQYQTLAERVKPRAEATHLRFDCADGYWEVAWLEEVANPRVVFVLKMNDELLLDEYGAPLRMMYPAKYGYKSAKAVTSITFTDQKDRGFWSSVGPYTVDGDIEPGVDYPQDLQGRREIGGGEITAY